MSDERFAKALNEQIAYEFGAAQQYIAIAVYYDAETLPRLAALFYRQALEERNHAMMMVQYLLDADEEVAIPGVEAPQSAFTDIVEPVALALEQEQRVTSQIGGLAALARELSDYAGEQFMQWFIKEQVEEVSSMSEPADAWSSVPARTRCWPRSTSRASRSATAAKDPTAPHAAGGAL